MVDLVGRVIVPKHELPFRDLFFCSPEYFCEPATQHYMENGREVAELDIAFDPEDILEQWLDEQDAEPFSQAVDSGNIGCARFFSKRGTLCELVRMNVFDEHGEYASTSEYENEDGPTNRYFAALRIRIPSTEKTLPPELYQFLTQEGYVPVTASDRIVAEIRDTP